MKWLDSIIAYLHSHGVSIVKDILIPTFGIDKIVAIIALLYAIKSFRISIKISKVNFHQQLAQSHREIWSKVLEYKLKRINDPTANPNKISKKERRHIIFIFLNMCTLHNAHKQNIYKFDKAARLDVSTFFNCPLPNRVWQDVSRYYPDDFVYFIEKVKQDPLADDSVFKSRTHLETIGERLISFPKFIFKKVFGPHNY